SRFCSSERSRPFFALTVQGNPYFSTWRKNSSRSALLRSVLVIRRQLHPPDYPVRTHRSNPINLDSEVHAAVPLLRLPITHDLVLALLQHVVSTITENRVDQSVVLARIVSHDPVARRAQTHAVIRVPSNAQKLPRDIVARVDVLPLPVGKHLSA